MLSHFPESEDTTTTIPSHMNQLHILKPVLLKSVIILSPHYAPVFQEIFAHSGKCKVIPADSMKVYRSGVILPHTLTSTLYGGKGLA
jgi:hypothetical protein